MRSKIIIAVMAILLVNMVAIRSNAADTKITIEQLEQEYGVEILIEQGYLSQEEALSMIDRMYGVFPEGLIKEVTDYYKAKGYKTRVRFIYKQTNLGGSYDISGKNIYLNYYPNPINNRFGDWTIAHEMGHLLHSYLQDKHGYTTLLNEWVIFNEGYEYNSDWYNAASGWEDSFAREYGTMNHSEDFATIIEYLVANQQDIRERLLKDEDSNLMKKISYLNNLLMTYTTSIESIENIWKGALLEKPNESIKSDIEEAYSYRLIPSSDDFNGLFTSNMTKEKFLEYVAYIIQEDKNLKLVDYVKSIGKKHKFYQTGSISTIDTIEGKEDVIDDWTKEHKTEITYFWVTQKGELKTDYAFKDAPDFTNLLHSLGIVETNKSGLFHGEALLTREEIAKYIYRMAIATGKEPIITEQQYADEDAIDDKLKLAVDFVITNNILDLKEGNRFAPKAFYTYEEAYVAMLNYVKTYAPHICVADEIDYISEAIYDKAHMHSEGVAAVKKDNHYAYIDKSGQEIIKIPYDNYVNASEFLNGKATIMVGDEEQDLIVIDTLGNELLKIDGKKINIRNVDKNGGFIEAKDKTGEEDFTYIDFYGNKYYYGYIYSFSDNEVTRVTSNSKYGVIDRTGKEIVPLIYDSIDLEDDLIIVKKSEEYGVFDMKGKEIIPCIYDYASLKGDYIVVSTNSDGYKEALFDKSGKVIVPEGIYSKIYPERFDNGNISVSKNGYESILDSKGNMKVKNVSSRKDDYIIIADENYKHYKVVDSDLNTLFENDKAVSYIGEGYFYEIRNATFNIFDRKGNVVRRGLENVTSFSEGLAIVKDSNKWEIVDDAFNTVAKVDSSKFKHASHFFNGMAEIWSDQKVGCMNTDGEVVVPPIYDRISRFTGNLSVIKLDDKYGCINKNGTVLIKPEYDEISINDTLIAVKKGDQYGLYNYRGFELLELGDYINIQALYRVPYAVVEKADYFQDQSGKKHNNKIYMDQYGEVYDDIRLLDEGDTKFIEVTKKETKIDAYGSTIENKLYGLMDETGNKILDTEYKDINVNLERRMIQVKNKEYQIGYVDYEGKEIIPIKYSQLYFRGDMDIAIASNGYKYGIIGERGNIIVPFKFEYLSIDKDKDVVLYKMNNKYGFFKYPKS